MSRVHIEIGVFRKQHFHNSKLSTIADAVCAYSDRVQNTHDNIYARALYALNTVKVILHYSNINTCDVSRMSFGRVRAIERSAHFN